MGGFFGAISKRDCVLDIFFGVDYHSHLGTRRGGMAIYDANTGFQRQIHNIENSPFRANGFRLLAAFDVDPVLVGTRLGGVPVYHAQMLESYMREHRVNVGVLTVPGSVAVESAMQLYQCGIQGIWNFTNIELPEQEMETVKVENVHFADSLLTLSYMISTEEQS